MEPDTVVLEAQGLEHREYGHEILSSLEKSSSDDFDHRFKFRGWQVLCLVTLPLLSPFFCPKRSPPSLRVESGKVHTTRSFSFPASPVYPRNQV
jgi:hypothetical protein